MRRHIFVATVALAALALSALNCPSAEKQEKIESRTEKISYFFGYQLGTQLKTLPFEIDIKPLSLGIADVLKGREVRMSEEEMKELQQSLAREMRQKQMEKYRATAKKNAENGEQFLAENKEKEGVVTTKSGLQYKVLREGKGQKPGATDTVTVNYRGKLLDGTVFDSSYQRGEATTFPLKNEMIPGWKEGLQKMKVGSKYRLFVPANLAYGPRGRGRHIPPNAVLIFDVELLGVEKADEEKGEEEDGEAKKKMEETIKRIEEDPKNK